MVGRGLLGKWGPNHAADPIVTRWKRDASGEKVMMKGKPCLEFVAIRRKDNGEWALPGVSWVVPPTLICYYYNNVLG